MTIGVVIADDQALLRGGFRLLIEAEADITVIGEAADGSQAVALARQAHPDVVLMDVRATLYELTELGRSLEAPLAAMAEWAGRNWQSVEEARRRRHRLRRAIR